MELEIAALGAGGGRPTGLGLRAGLTVRLAGEDAKKPGVCPQLQADLNCTQECLSDAQCAGNLKCCQAGCATRCHLPNGNPGAPGAGRGRARWAGGGGAPGSGNGPPTPTPGTPAESRRMEPDPSCASSRGPGKTKAPLKISRGLGAGGGPPPLAGFHSLVRDGFRASTSWDGVPGGQGTRFTVSSPAGWSRGEARGWREGWVPRPEALSPLGVPPLGPPPALGAGLGAPGLARLPGFLCPDGKRLYTLRRAPSPS